MADKHTTEARLIEIKKFERKVAAAEREWAEAKADATAAKKVYEERVESLCDLIREDLPLLEQTDTPSTP